MRSAAVISRWALGLSLFSNAAAAAPFATPVKRAADPSAFAPAGYSIEQSIEGHLNEDAIADRVLVLLQDPHPNGDRERALVVLLGEDDGWAVAGTSSTLLACFDCLGVKDAGPDVVVEKRVLSISQFGGSRSYYGATHRFRWSAVASRFELIGLDSIQGDSVLGSSTEISANYLTREGVTTTQPPQEHDVARSAPLEVVKRKLPRAPLEPLEDVKWSS